MANTEIGAVKSVAGKFGRIVEADHGQGLFGWYPVRFDRDSPDDDCWFELSKPDTRYKLRHTKVACLLGADATEHGDPTPRPPMQAIASLFYGKPDGPDARGILEMPVVIYDPASTLIVVYFTWPEKGLACPSLAWVKR